MDSEAPLEVFALPSFVCAGLSASEGSTVLLATGMQAGEAGGESEAVEDEAEQKDWWHGEWNVDRVRQWRAEHPGYWRRWKRKKVVALQNTMKTAQLSGPEKDKCDVTGRVRYKIRSRAAKSAIACGGGAYCADVRGEGEVALQNTIAAVTARLFEKGRAVIGQ